MQDHDEGLAGTPASEADQLPLHLLGECTDLSTAVGKTQKTHQAHALQTDTGVL